jgi:MFS family permease
MRLVSSLRYRNWRYLWSGLMVSQTGDWMDSLAINWLVLVLTNSPLALGTVNLVRGLPTLLLSLVGGVVADRFDRRWLMVWTQVGQALCTAVLAWLATEGILQIWHIYGLLIVRGVVQAINSPARSSIVGDLVPRSDITNAIALHSTVFNATRMIGPALAGVLIGAYGSALVLWISAATHLMCAWATFRMEPGAGKTPRPKSSAWQSVGEGVAYLRGEPVVLMLLILGVVPFILGNPYQSMLPVFAKDVLVVGPEGLGFLTTAAAAGSLISAFLIAGLGDFPKKGLVMIFGLLAFGTLLVAFAYTPWPWVAGVLLFLIGASTQLYQTTNATLMQLLVPTEYRGRVFGIHQMDRGFIPVGSFLAGAIAQVAGAPFAVAIMGGTLALAGLGVLLFLPRMRNLE